MITRAQSSKNKEIKRVKLEDGDIKKLDDEIKKIKNEQTRLEIELCELKSTQK